MKKLMELTMSTQDAYYILSVKDKDGNVKGFITSSHTCHSESLAKTFNTYDDAIDYIESFRKILSDKFQNATFGIALVTTTITTITEYPAWFV